MYGQTRSNPYLTGNRASYGGPAQQVTGGRLPSRKTNKPTVSGGYGTPAASSPGAQMPWWQSNARENKQIYDDWKKSADYRTMAQIDSSIRSLQAQFTGGWNGGAVQRRIDELKKQRSQLSGPQLKNTNASPMDRANYENNKRYGQVIGGYNSLIGATRDRLNQRSDQAVEDINSGFQAKSTANRQDLVSRGLAASTVGSGMDAMYERQRQSSINDARDSQLAQYNATMIPLYQSMYGVVERKNDIAPDMNLYANLQRGVGYAAGGYGGGSYMPASAMGYNVPMQASGYFPNLWYGGGGGGGGYSSGGAINYNSLVGPGGAFDPNKNVNQMPVIDANRITAAQYQALRDAQGRAMFS